MPVNVVDINGINQSLINAVRVRNIELVKTFLSYGANPTGKVNGTSAVETAMTMSEHDMMEALVTLTKKLKTDL